MVVITATPLTPHHRWSPGSNSRKNQINSVFLQRNWRVETMGSGTTRLCDGGASWLLQNEGDWVCGTGETGAETLWEQNGLPWKHSAENQWVGGRRGKDKKPNYVAGGERGWELREAQSLAFRAGWKHIFCIPGFENVSPGDGSDSQTG